MRMDCNFTDFTDTFKKYRNGDSFTYEGLQVLYDYLDNNFGSEEEYDFNVANVDCEYSEYNNLDAIKEDYSAEEIETIEDLRELTQVIEVTGTDRIIIYTTF